MVVGADRVVRIWWGAQLTSGTQYGRQGMMTKIWSELNLNFL